MDGPSSSRKPHARWASPADRILIKELLRRLHNDKKVNNKWSAGTWSHVTAQLNKSSARTGHPVLSVLQVKTRYFALKKSWGDFSHLLKTDGIYWDGEGKIHADEEVWEEYLKAHPKARVFKQKPLENFKDLCKLFGDTSVRGSQAIGQAGGQLYEDQDEDEDEDEETEKSEGRGPSKEKTQVNEFSHQDSPIPSNDSVRDKNSYFPTSSIITPSLNTPHNYWRPTSSYSTGSFYPAPSAPSAYLKSSTPRRYDGHNTAHSGYSRYSGHSGYSGYRKRRYFSPTRGHNNARGLAEIADIFASEIDRLITTIKSHQEKEQQRKTPELPAQYVPYANAASKAVKLYCYRDISKKNLHLALSALKNDPLECITFSLMTDNLCVDWIMDRVKESEGRASGAEA
ncbi:hypothetical protein HOY80DRAFT_1022228 [Tuber brumale]|nr:hypothetical protein HOY80DRAFT_1022228 [Tuber brumale]